MLYRSVPLAGLFFITPLFGAGNIKCQGENHALKAVIAHGNGSPIVSDLTLTFPDKTQKTIPQSLVTQYKNYKNELFIMANDPGAIQFFLLDTRETFKTKDSGMTKGFLKFFKTSSDTKSKIIKISCHRN